MLSLRRHRQALTVLILLACLSLAAAGDELWSLLQQARPGLARQRLSRPTPLQSAQIAYAEGEFGEAWQFIRQLEQVYQPEQQPAEFFWVRGMLLRPDNWDLSSKNLAGILQKPCSRELRIAALSMLAQGAAEQHLESDSRQYWSEATAQAALLGPDQVPALVRLSLIQANLQILHDQASQAQATLLSARALAQRAKLPALAALAELKRAEVEIELTDWQAFPHTCLRALEQARACPEPWLVEKICTFWVDQQLARRSEPRAVSQCVNALDMAQGWFEGTARLAVMRSLARAQTLGLNRREAGQAILRKAWRLCPPGKLRVRIVAERLAQIPPQQKSERRRCLEGLLVDLSQLGPLQPEDPILRALPRAGAWAALADTYLPEQPDKAEEYFQKAFQAAPTAAARLEVVNYQLQRYNAAGSWQRARQSLSRLLDLVKAAPLDLEAARILRTQMFALRSEARQMTRLLMHDEMRPPPESPALNVVTELLHEEGLQSKLERDIYERIRRSQNYRESSEAYLARAELLSVQNRWGESILALERMQQAARQGGWPLREAQALRMMADAYWTLGRAERALESIAAAQALYATSPNRRDQRAASDCKLLRAYFLLRSGRPGPALALCEDSQEPWFIFLSARCHLALNQPEAAQRVLVSCRFEEGPAEIGRLIYQARCSTHPDPLYQQAYQQAQLFGQLSLGDVALEWSAWLNQQGQSDRAQEIEKQAGDRLRGLLQEYPEPVRERLLDLPSTQKLLGSHRPVSSPEELPRQSRREFLARTNEIRQRYPGLDSALAVSPTDLVALQETIPENRVLLQYFSADTDLYIMKVDRQGCRVVQVAVESSVLQGWTQEVREALKNGSELPPDPAHRLYLSLVEPLGVELRGKQVQVIPNGFFWYLPWDVLQDHQERYLVESQEWSCVSPSQLVRRGFRGRPGSAELERALAVGGTSGNLPATSREASRVASLFSRGQALLGAQARASELIRLAPQAQVIHLAAHSGLSSDLNQTYIELSDGRFSLEQVYGLQLERGCQVILSSCESALGQSAPGREVSSLASAFLASGASSVVATLWPVEDEASAAFFERFYPLLLQKRTISDALRQARLECLADPNLRQPHGWGAYQLIGDPG